MPACCLITNLVSALKAMWEIVNYVFTSHHDSPALLSPDAYLTSPPDR